VDGRQNTLDASMYRDAGPVDSLSLEGPNVRAKEVFGIGNVLPQDWAVGKQVGIHNLTVRLGTWEHNDVLDPPGLYSIMILLSSVLLLAIVHKVNECPAGRVLLLRTGTHVETFRHRREPDHLPSGNFNVELIGDRAIIPYITMLCHEVK
jgi:hypothetical protein